MEYDVDKWDMEDFDDSPMNNKNERDVKMAREYCDEHEFNYKNHTCEPTWINTLFYYIRIKKNEMLL